MTKTALLGRADYVCAACGQRSARWLGRCPECRGWGTLAQRAAPAGWPAGPVERAAQRIGAVDPQAARAQPTGIGELDRVLGGGLVPGGVVLLAGEPGVGKSTLLLAAAASFADAGGPVLIVSGEESAAQVRLRAERIGAVHPGVWLAAEGDLAAVLGHVEAVDPALLVVDSVQTTAIAGVEGSAGGVAQVREVAAALIGVAKRRGMATVLVGHVTKDGAVAGPRTLEHLVDVVLSFDGERGSRLRLLRASKNRYGPTDEVGCFELADAGLRELADPSGLFRSGRSEPVAGSATTVSSEGRRSILAEVQALVVPSRGGPPRRATAGLDAARVAMVVAVLERHCRLPVSGSDVYAATVGGIRLAEPAADLALALALASSVRDRALPAGVVAFGEVGLGGEVRPVVAAGRRLAEAARLGAGRALVPPGAAPPGRARWDGLEVIEVADLAAALANC